MNPFRFYTHLGTDYGPMGPGEGSISWQSGRIVVDLAGPKTPGWAGMWHSLDGLSWENKRLLDFTRCYPTFITDKYQPRCVALLLRVEGRGLLKLEIKSPRSLAERVLWQCLLKLDTKGITREFILDCPAKKLRGAKFLNWVAEPGSRLSIDAIGLVLEFPDVSFEERVFLISYAKLSLCYSEADGLVKDRANFPAGQQDALPASGMFCLATCAAWKMGIVDETFARETLRRIHKRASSLPKAHGILPHFVRKRDGRYRILPGSEYSTIDASLYYHGMLLAAQMLSDRLVLADLAKDIKAIRFSKLRDANDWIIHGLKEDGHAKLGACWQNWGGETALVLLLERMAAGGAARPKMSRSGKVFGGVGFIAEIQSLFYPHFSEDKPDAISGVNWLRARRRLLKEQIEYFRSSPAGKIGAYGLSAGEGARGLRYVANGTQTTPKANIVHPHYMLMSALVHESPESVYHSLRAMADRKLLPPWGLVENLAADLKEYHPMIGSLNASFEAISAYHLWARTTGKPDRIYRAAQRCALLAEAIKAFYPRAKHVQGKNSR